MFKVKSFSVNVKYLFPRQTTHISRQLNRQQQQQQPQGREQFGEMIHWGLVIGQIK